jgi:hypothetical protein
MRGIFRVYQALPPKVFKSFANQGLISKLKDRGYAKEYWPWLN